MHRTTKRLASALLAAVLCAAAALPAGADYEPWTYEVDDLMGSYGVEYYGDVGFTDPTAGRSAARSPASAGVSTQSAGTAGGVSTYSAAETGRAVAAYADENAVTESEQNTVTLENAYTVTIPAEVTVTDETPAELAVTGKLEKHCKLTIGVESDSNYRLKCTDNNQYYIDYTLTGFPTTTKQFEYETTTDAETINRKLIVTLDENNRNDIVSGNYTDTLKFTFDCTLKPYAVIRYESKDTTQDVASNTEFEHHSVWEANPEEEELTDETTTFWNKNTNELDDWREENQTVTLQAGQQKYEVDFHRKMYAFDLNVAFWDSDNNKYRPASSHSDAGTIESIVLSNWGRANIVINGKNRTPNPVGDYYTGHAKSSEYSFELTKTGADYTILGYMEDVKSDDLPTTKDGVKQFDGTISGTITSNSEHTPSKDTGAYYTYYLWIFVEQKDTSTSSMVGDDVILPSLDETKPVVIEMPATDLDDAADTKADTKKDTAADTTTDTTGTTKDTAKTDDTAKDTDTISSIFDDPEQDITPDDLMITDADDMLARMDAAFAMPYLDDPA